MPSVTLRALTDMPWLRGGEYGCPFTSRIRGVIRNGKPANVRAGSPNAA